MPRRLRVLLAVLPVLLLSCGGGSSPSATSPPVSSTPPPSGRVALTVVDGEGAPVTGVTLKVDSVSRSPRVPGGHVFDVERVLAGHALDVERDGFLVHQNSVPDGDRTFDLFEVPRDGSKAWIRSFLYDGAISLNGSLARLLQPVSIVRGNTLTAANWARVRPVWEEAAERLSAVTGYAFRLADEPQAGTVAFTVDLDPTLAFGGYFEWTGRSNVIGRGTVRFRNPDRLGQFSLVLHELTHGFGLSHSDRTIDVMHPSAVSSTHTERELLVIAAVKRRPANTAFEDNVRAATSAVAGSVFRSYSCGAE